MTDPALDPPSPAGLREAIVTVVYGDHAGQLDYSFASFRRNTGVPLHAFVVGDRLPANQVEGITYHRREPDPAYVHPMRDVDYRRWLFIDELDADVALVVDGMDVLCLQPLGSLARLLKGGWIGAAVEHSGGRYLGNGLYTSNFVNAGVTLWDIRASAPLRQEIAARGRARFRNLVDDQLALNELLHTRYVDRLTLLPCHYNYRGSLGPKPFGWPVCRSLDGIRIYHNRHWIREARKLAPDAQAPLANLDTDIAPPGKWGQRLVRLACRWRRTGYPPLWPLW